MRKLYKFNADFGRMGKLEGVFAAEEVDIDGLCGQEVYFGEVLGKHSEIVLTVDNDHLTILTDDQGFIDKAIEYELVPCGHNPFDYLNE